MKRSRTRSSSPSPGSNSLKPAYDVATDGEYLIVWNYLYAVLSPQPGLATRQQKIKLLA
jgi:hypothetical protein